MQSTEFRMHNSYTAKLNDDNYGDCTISLDFFEERGPNILNQHLFHKS